MAWNIKNNVNTNYTKNTHHKARHAHLLAGLLDGLGPLAESGGLKLLLAECELFLAAKKHADRCHQSHKCHHYRT